MDLYKIKKYLSILAVVLIIARLLSMDFNDLSWETNSASYLGIISMLFLLVGSVMDYRTKKNK